MDNKNFTVRVHSETASNNEFLGACLIFGFFFFNVFSTTEGLELSVVGSKTNCV
jgi:hypothetical protein